jgi:hypothetical protein
VQFALLAACFLLVFCFIYSSTMKMGMDTLFRIVSEISIELFTSTTQIVEYRGRAAGASSRDSNYGGEK